MIGCRRTTLAVLLAVSLTLAMSACDESDGPPPAERITLVTPPSPSLAPLYVARAKGYFREDGLDVRLRRQGVGVSAMRDLLDGKADIAAVADPPIARAVLVGQEPVIIGTFDRVENLTYVVARRDRGIATVEDLAGKNVGVIRDNIGEYFLHVYLVTSGIDPDSVRVTYLEAAEMPRSRGWARGRHKLGAAVHGHRSRAAWSERGGPATPRSLHRDLVLRHPSSRRQRAQ